MLALLPNGEALKPNDGALQPNGGVLQPNAGALHDAEDKYTIHTLFILSTL